MAYDNAARGGGRRHLGYNSSNRSTSIKSTFYRPPDTSGRAPFIKGTPLPMKDCGLSQNSLRRFLGARQDFGKSEIFTRKRNAERRSITTDVYKQTV